MCNHYRKSPAVLDLGVRRIRGLRTPVPIAEIHEHTFPKYPAPLVIAEGGERLLVEARWGVERFIGEGRTKPVTNARNDKLGSRTWKTCTETRRCLIPATGYFEPGLGPVGARGEILFTVTDRPAFFFAGLWDTGKDGREFTMVTTEPNDFVHRYHDRMPVVLDDAGIEAWLGDSPLAPDEIVRLCRGLLSEALLHEELAPKLKIARPPKTPPPPEPCRYGSPLQDGLR